MPSGQAEEFIKLVKQMKGCEVRLCPRTFAQTHFSEFLPKGAASRVSLCRLCCKSGFSRETKATDHRACFLSLSLSLSSPLSLHHVKTQRVGKTALPGTQLVATLTLDFPPSEL